jgi:hypothetical protein
MVGINFPDLMTSVLFRSMTMIFFSFHLFENSLPRLTFVLLEAQSNAKCLLEINDQDFLCNFRLRDFSKKLASFLLKFSSSETHGFPPRVLPNTNG